jgi:mono/diheme cytochrome c family protein
MRKVQIMSKSLLLAFGLLLSGPALAASVEEGRIAFKNNGCWQCHGFEAQGGQGPRLNAENLPLEAFTSFVRSTNRQMPPYSESILPDATLANIYEFIKAQPKGKDQALLKDR